MWGAVSDDLRAWTPVPFLIGTAIEGRIPGDKPWRYVRLDGCPDLVREARASYRGVPVERVGWRASNLFSTYGAARAERTWQASFRLDEIVPGAYLAIAVHGRHGRELVSAALRVDGAAYRGVPRRSPSFPANAWECPVRTCDGDSTWYLPLDRDLIGRRLDAVVLGLRGHTAPSGCEVWITANHAPSTVREIELG